jgi:hypothetical protein
MDNEQSSKEHLTALLKAASSLNLYNSNPVTFKVAVNDYRFYKQKHLVIYKKLDLIEDGSGAQVLWKEIKHPFDGKVKMGFDLKKREHYYNSPF